jgi:ERCC4-related helicase
MAGTYRTPMLDALRAMYHGYDIMTDPYVLQLVERNRAGHGCYAALDKVILRRKTYCIEQLKSLLTKAEAMVNELGPSPTEWYLKQCISKYEKIAGSSDQQLLDWSTKEKQHLSILFRTIDASDAVNNSNISLDGLSPKVDRLIDVLISEASCDFTGLVFVEQRAWVAALGEILSNHPRTEGLFSVGTFVGTSNSMKRKGNVADLAAVRNQLDTLEHFRAGRVNLVIATSVLEEGIDVPSCHLVICFERPKNLKSFIQRRGRARRQKSKLIVFTQDLDASASPGTWESLENEMKDIYLNDLREVNLADQREQEFEEGTLSYTVPSTGYVLYFQ